MLFPRTKLEALLCGSLVILVVAAFAPVGKNRFVNFDDGVYLHQNPQVQSGLSAKTIGWAFTTGDASNWHPVTWIAHTINWGLYGANPRGHHYTSVALHALSSVILFLLLVRMTSPDPPSASKSRRRAASQSSTSIWPAALVAGLFAVHPLRVESVAWAAELKDVLCTLFWWLTIAAYVGYVRHQSGGRYAVMATLFVLGLMSKPMIVTLPLVLLLLDYWPLGRFPAPGSAALSLSRQFGRLLVEKIPLFVLSAVSCVATYIAQSRGGSTEMLAPVPLHLRLANAAISLIAYVRQAIWPTRLACYYPYPRDALTETGLWRFDVIASITAIVLATIAALWFGRRHRYLLVGWLWYLVTLVPVIGIVQVGSQARADRYTYVPLVGVFLLVSWGLCGVIAKRSLFVQRSAFTIAGAALLLLCVLTWRQVTFWHDDVTLFAHAAAEVPANDVAERNLGSAYFMQGDTAKAIDHLRKSIEYFPEYAPSYRNLALVQEKLGRQRDAEKNFQEALRRDPSWALVRCNLATLYSTSKLPELHKPAEAVQLAEQAVQITGGNDILCLEVLSAVYAANGDLPKAIEAAARGHTLALTTGQHGYAQAFARNIALLRSHLQNRRTATAN